VDKPAILSAVARAVRIKEMEDEKRRLEAENRDYQKNLEQLVGQRTCDLEDALAKLKDAQTQLIQQERMNALAQMASGIAHDFNNVLMPIVGLSGVLMDTDRPWNDRKGVTEMLSMIRAAGDDARRIVRRLRQIYKEEEPQHESIDLSQVVEGAVSLTAPKWKQEMNAKGAGVEVVTEFEPIPPINGDASELREALTNLIFNAVDAMPEGGALTLRLKPNGEGSVVLEVCDTGVGMDDEVLRRCAEPSFTTKGEHGTGLGLPMVLGIVARHGGNMKVDSTPAEGTTIRMWFPVPAAPNVVTGAGRAEPALLRPLRVLVVDDEAQSRTLVARFLKTDGHEVTAAEGGRKALALFGQGEFDLVITDRAMPLMSGDEVAVRIRDAAPATPVIMLTGFGDIMMDKGEVPPGVTRVMPKPVTRKELGRVIADVLRGEGK
jgi:signal transduction histidine kinase